MDLVDYLRESHKAQRTSDFMLYLKSLQNRLPYFPASGHNNYAKSVHIFLQDMIALKDTNLRAYAQFNDGLYFIRRSDRYWSAIPSDLLIEQELMASLKNTKSGLTHGRGLEEKQRLIWLYSRPVFAHIKSQLDNLHNNTSKDIIKDLTESRIKEDTKDISKILEYLEQHDPFAIDNEHLVDISTGVSYSEANAHKSLEIGNAILKKMDGQNVSQYSFKKVERIIQMGAKVEIGKENVVINPQLFFQKNAYYC